MAEVELYFPATILSQYVGVANISDLRSLSDVDPVHLYLEFNKPSDEDVDTTILMPPNLREWYIRYRESLRGKVLGKDVVLMFSIHDEVIVDWDQSDLEYYLITRGFDSLMEHESKLRLRKYKVIERVITTDMLFRLYYSISDRIRDELTRFWELRREVAFFNMRRATRYAFVERDYLPYNREHGGNAMHIYHPQELRGFKTKCFPLLSWSGLIQLGMLHFIVSDRWRELNIFKNVPYEFIKECEEEFDKHVNRYKAHLKNFIAEVERIKAEEDPLERFILSNLPATTLEICERGEMIGYRWSEVLSTIESLRKRGLIFEKDYQWRVKNGEGREG